MRTFHDIPSIVFSAVAHSRLKIDLLGDVLADVTDKEVAGETVKRESEGISETQRPDLRPETGGAEKGVG